MNKKVAIILLNYCGVEDTLECVKSLEAIDYKNYEIIIVDNNSPDNSYEVLKQSIGDKHTLIKAESNGGFAKGNNIGIDYALKSGCDYVLLLNNDTIVEKDFLGHMVNCYESNPNIGIVGCKIPYYNKKDYIWFAGGEINYNRFYGSHYGEGQLDKEAFNKEKKVTFTTGCVMLIGVEVIKTVGMLPEEYFMYFEDVDYCVKVLEKGYNIYYCPKAIVYHKVSATSGGQLSPFSIKWSTRNRLIFMEKYKNKVSKIQYIKAKAFFYSTRRVKIINYSITGRKEEAKAIKEGIEQGVSYLKNN
ncbi:GT2 family glycosyltransferase [Clostridium punense]|uniref:GT2 family glycosyltransferase n=1 Tax=Clostridium punense TaxID=1054297 RepID=A0ABS4K066_9CLOT|nr:MULTISPECIES: glycosyltransferase family 2 protein [Clostridium]EQB88386.1 hypothetical protein M918_04390 [Clostridium sp. BL8]MBP2021170.1 GT2 family glycosyltransferase [Clostridium punense]